MLKSAGVSGASGASERPPEPAYARTSVLAYAPIVVASIGTLAADVATKIWATRHLSGLFRRVDLFPGLSFALRKNYRDSWELLPRMDAGINRLVLPLIAVGAIAFALAARRALGTHSRTLSHAESRSHSRAGSWGAALLLAGAIGNLLDRIRLGYVVDFIDAHSALGKLRGHAPSVNVADLAIGVGACLLALQIFRRRRSPVSP
jgi:signal peptidase II